MHGSLYTIMSEVRPSLADAARILNVPESALDTVFGIILLDPEKHLYCVLISGDVVAPEPLHMSVQGPFGNERIVEV